MPRKYLAPFLAGLSAIALFSLGCPCLRAGEGGELGALATKYGTDKGPKYHNYTETYEYFFRPVKETARNICEIGIEEGASLKMWEGYFRRASISSTVPGSTPGPSGPSERTRRTGSS